MNNYDVEMELPHSHLLDARVRIQTDNRVLFDAMIEAVEQVYKIYYNGRLTREAIINVEVV